MQEIKVIEQLTKEKYETEVNDLLYRGYKIMNTDCNFGYRAILIVDNEKQ